MQAKGPWNAHHGHPNECPLKCPAVPLSAVRQESYHMSPHISWVVTKSRIAPTEDN